MENWDVPLQKSYTSAAENDSTALKIRPALFNQDEPFSTYH